MAASDYYDQIQTLYIAYFGRPADPAGLQYWASQANATNGNLGAVVAGFAASTESTTLFGGLPSAQKISSIYLNLFNRQPEPAGLAYWVAQLESGTISQAEAAYQILTAAGPGDSRSIANKLAMANAFTAQLDTPQEIAGYSGVQSATFGRAFLSGVDATPASVNTATSNLPATVVNATGVNASAPAVSTPSVPSGDTTFTLTTGTDTFVGGAGNDTFKAKIDTSNNANSTLTQGDSIDGGAGTDTLLLTISGATGLPQSIVTIKNIETLQVTDQNTSGVQTSFGSLSSLGITKVISSLSTATGGLKFSGMSTGSSLSVVGDGATQLANVNFSYQNASDAVTLVLDGGVKTAQIANDSGKATTATVTSSGASNTVGTLMLAGSQVGTLTNLTINAQSNLTTSLQSKDFASTSTLTVTGAGKVDLGTTTIGFRGANVDASANTGGLSMALFSDTTSFKGSQGDDRVTGVSSTVISNSAVIDGGDGTDTLLATLITLPGGNAAAFKNFELLELTGASSLNGGTLNAGLLSNSTLTGVVLAGSTNGAVTLYNLANKSVSFDVNVLADSAGADTTLEFKDTSAADDVLNINFNSTSTAANAGALSTLGIETIKINSAGVAGANNRISITDNGLKSVQISGSEALTVTLNTQNATSVTVDASKATGSLNITTGAGNDLIKLATSALSGSTGPIVTTGNGTDKVDVSSASLVDVSALSKLQYTTWTDASHAEALVFNPGSTFNTVQVTPTAPADLLAAAQQVANLSAINQVSWFTYAGNTYVLANDAAAGLGSGDVLVKLTGVLDLEASSMSGGTLTLLFPA